MNDKILANPQIAWLAMLRDQRDKIDAAIKAIEALEGIPLSGSPSGAGVKQDQSPANGEVDIPLDAFHRLTVSQGIRKYLGMRNRRPATTAEIVEALKQGGQNGAEGSNFTVVVGNTLNRMQAPDGGISKVKRGVWGLSEWYENKD